jgi:hypothetical protein
MFLDGISEIEEGLVGLSPVELVGGVGGVEMLEVQFANFSEGC